jgi:hypothetical protein
LGLRAGNSKGLLFNCIPDASERIIVPTECLLQRVPQVRNIKAAQAGPWRSRARATMGGRDAIQGVAMHQTDLAPGIDEILPSAKEFMKKLAVREAAEASKQALNDKKAAAEQESLLEQLRKPSGISDDEAVRRGVKMIERAVRNGLTEVQVYRFPNSLCTDHGRAINQQENGWEETLAGIPREIYLLWERHFRERGYKLKVEIIDFPGGMPGDVGMTLKWG